MNLLNYCKSVCIILVSVSFVSLTVVGQHVDSTVSSVSNRIIMIDGTSLVLNLAHAEGWSVTDALNFTRWPESETSDKTLLILSHYNHTAYSSYNDHHKTSYLYPVTIKIL